MWGIITPIGLMQMGGIVFLVWRLLKMLREKRGNVVWEAGCAGVIKVMRLLS